MEKFLFYLLFMAFCHCSNNLFAQKIIFSYDASGNQTERKWVFINRVPIRVSNVTNQLAIANQLGKLDKENNKEKMLNIFPNPVSEILNVVWSLPDKIYVKNMEVFSITGNRVFGVWYKPDQKHAQINFSDLPPGIYLLIIKYSDNNSESVKLIKI